MISIELNKKLDHEVYKDFCNLKIAGADFSALIKKEHPDISLENSEQYIDNFYKTNAVVLQKSCDDLLGAINLKQDIFFGALENLFKTDFRQTSFKGYLSIFDCNPRFVESNEFQVFYKRSLNSKLAVIFHEVLHFAFFAYCEANFAEKMKGLDKNSGKLWELSEIFNVIVLNTKEFSKITCREEKLFYPQLQDKLDEARMIWAKSNGQLKQLIDQLI